MTLQEYMRKIIESNYEAEIDPECIVSKSEKIQIKCDGLEDDGYFEE